MSIGLLLPHHSASPQAARAGIPDRNGVAGTEEQTMTIEELTGL